MRDRYWHFPAKIAAPVLAAGFIYDCWTDGLTEGVRQFPLRAGIMLVIVLVWSMVRKRQEQKSRKFY